MKTDIFKDTENDLKEFIKSIVSIKEKYLLKNQKKLQRKVVEDHQLWDSTNRKCRNS